MVARKAEQGKLLDSKIDMNKKEIKKEQISIGRRKTENKSKGRKKGGKDKDKKLNK